MPMFLEFWTFGQIFVHETKIVRGYHFEMKTNPEFDQLSMYIFSAVSQYTWPLIN